MAAKKVAIACIQRYEVEDQNFGTKNATVFDEGETYQRDPQSARFLLSKPEYFKVASEKDLDTLNQEVPVSKSFAPPRPGKKPPAADARRDKKDSDKGPEKVLGRESIADDTALELAEANDIVVLQNMKKEAEAAQDMDRVAILDKAIGLK